MKDDKDMATTPEEEDPDVEVGTVLSAEEGNRLIDEPVEEENE